MIKNLLFDLGGVIMDIERENCIRAFETLGMKNIRDFLGDYAQQGIFAALEEGRISVEDFRDAVRKDCPEGTTNEQIDEAFEEFLIGIPMYRLEMLLELKEEYNVYMLSNTNPIMWNDRIAEQFRQIPGLDVNSYFDGIVTSFEAHSLKPAPEIFRYAETKLDIIPAETLFLDDSQANVEAARALGFNAEVVPTDGDVFSIIYTFLSNYSGK